MPLTIVKPSKYADKKLLTDVAEEVFSFLGADFEVGVKFACETCVRKLNKQYRGIDKATNVLSFNSDKDSLDGDIVICEAVVEQEAKTAGTDPASLVLLYLVHGMLHLAGFDHQNSKDRDKMEKIEESIISKFGVLVERN